MNQNEKPVIICGIGGHAKVIADSLLKSRRNILGFVTPEESPEKLIFGLKVLGDDSIINDYSVNEIILANGIGALPGAENRWNYASRIREKGYRFSKIIHPSAIIADGVKLEEGVQVMAGSVIQPNVSIGIDSIINTGVLVDHDCQIANQCHLAPGVVCSGGVSIGQGAHLGTGTKVIENISIGENSIIAAGSIVYRDIPSNVRLIQKRQLSIT